MKRTELDRRKFLTSSLAGLSGVWLGSAMCRSQGAETTSAKLPLVRLGTHWLEKPPKGPDELALAHRKLGYRAAIAPGIAVSDSERIRVIREAFARHDIVIASVDALRCNLLHPDAATRARNRQKLKDQLMVADKLGARCCAVLVGTFSPEKDSSEQDHPDNRTARFWSEFPAALRGLLDEVKPKRTKLAIHPYGWLEKADDYLRLFHAVDHEGLAALLHFGGWGPQDTTAWGSRNPTTLAEWFEKLGPRTVCCHAMRQDLHARWFARKKGLPLPELKTTEAEDELHRAFLRGVAALPGEVPVLLENPLPEDRGVLPGYYAGLGKALGIRFD